MLPSPPPRDIPSALMQSFTMGRRVHVKYEYYDDRAPLSEPRSYSAAQLQEYLTQISHRKTFYYGKTDFFLYRALEKYSIRGLKVAVIGSAQPLYEAMTLYYGGIPYTIDYQNIRMDDERLNYLPVTAYDTHKEYFDIAICISSIEHDGLGRYGDPIDPHGDLKAITKIYGLLKKQGLLFLAVPVGEDALVWNAHRIYGKNRIPLLFKGWSLIDFFGFHSFKVSQPVFVLCKSKSQHLGVVICFYLLGLFRLSGIFIRLRQRLAKMLKPNFVISPRKST